MVNLIDQNLSNFKIGKKIGVGSYGIVYESVLDFPEIGERKLIAIKRNVAVKYTHGMFAIKEADLLNRLSNHPFMVEQLGMIYTLPIVDYSNEVVETSSYFFQDQLGKNFKKSDKNDAIHFALSLESSNLEQLNKKKIEFGYQTIQIIFAQILIGLDWMHSQGVVHRDIKPGNILFNRSVSNPHVRICDLGMCGNYLRNQDQKLSTPRTVTAWYRAPEICFKKSYDEKIDIWATGLVFFELISGEALFYDVEDSSVKILTEIFNKVPELISISAIEKMCEVDLTNSFSENSILKSLKEKIDSKTFSNIIKNTEASTEARHSLVVKKIRSLLRLRINEIQKFNEQLNNHSLKKDHYSDFCDLIGKMIAFDPDQRLTASECLNHRFFYNIKDYISSVNNNTNNNQQQQLPPIKIVVDMKRKISTALIINIYNNREKLKWYNHKIIFHTLQTLDFYFASNKNFSNYYLREIRLFNNNNDSFKIDIDPITDIYLQTFTVLYMFHKYFSTMDIYETWNDFAPKGYSLDILINRSLVFEKFIFFEVCNGIIYYPSLFEIITYKNGRVSETKIRQALDSLKQFGEDGGWEGGNVYNLFDTIFNSSS